MTELVPNNFITSKKRLSSLKQIRLNSEIERTIQ